MSRKRILFIGAGMISQNSKVKIQKPRGNHHGSMFFFGSGLILSKKLLFEIFVHRRERRTRSSAELLETFLQISEISRIRRNCKLLCAPLRPPFSAVNKPVIKKFTNTIDISRPCFASPPPQTLLFPVLYPFCRSTTHLLYQPL